MGYTTSLCLYPMTWFYDALRCIFRADNKFQEEFTTPIFLLKILRVQKARKILKIKGLYLYA